MIKKLTFIPILVFLSLIACGGGGGNVVGVWEAHVPDTDRYLSTGIKPYRFAQYAILENGQRCTLLFKVSETGTETLAYLNRWSLEGDELTITYGRNNAGVPVGAIDREKIVQWTDHLMVYRDIEDGGLSDTPVTLTRLSEVNPQSICRLALAILDSSADDASAE